MVVDKSGVEIIVGCSVLVHQIEEIRTAIVVSISDNPTTCAPGFWVDVNIGGRGAEGMPSYILEVINDKI